MSRGNAGMISDTGISPGVLCSSQRGIYHSPQPFKLKIVPCLIMSPHDSNNIPGHNTQSQVTLQGLKRKRAESHSNARARSIIIQYLVHHYTRASERFRVSLRVIKAGLQLYHCLSQSHISVSLAILLSAQLKPNPRHPVRTVLTITTSTSPRQKASHVKRSLRSFSPALKNR